MKSKCKIKYLLMSIFISLVIIILPNRIYAAWYEGGLTHINDRSVASVFYSMRYFAEKDGEDRRKWIQQEYTGNAIDNKEILWDSEWIPHLEDKYADWIHSRDDYKASGGIMSMIGALCYGHPKTTYGIQSKKILEVVEHIKISPHADDGTTKTQQYLAYAIYNSITKKETGYDATHKKEIRGWLRKNATSLQASDAPASAYNTSDAVGYVDKATSKMKIIKKDDDGKKITATIEDSKISGYITIGPIQIENKTGHITYFQLYKDNRLLDSSKQYYYSTSKNKTSTDDLSKFNESNFVSGKIYLYVKKSGVSNYSTTTKVKIYRKYEVIEAKLVGWWAAGGDGNQDMAVFDAVKYTESDDIDAPVKVIDPTSANLELEKVGSISREPLQGIGFVFLKYIKADSGDTGSYVRNGTTDVARHVKIYPLESGKDNNSYNYVKGGYEGSNPNAYPIPATGETDPDGTSIPATRDIVVGKENGENITRTCYYVGKRTAKKNNVTYTIYQYSENYYTNAADRKNWRKKDSSGNFVNYTYEGGDEYKTFCQHGTAAGQSNADSGHERPWVECDVYEVYRKDGGWHKWSTTPTGSPTKQWHSLNARARGDFYWRPLYKRQYLSNKKTNGVYEWENVGYSTAQTNNIFYTNSEGIIDLNGISIPEDTNIGIWAMEVSIPDNLKNRLKKIDGKQGYKGIVYPTSPIRIGVINDSNHIELEAQVPNEETDIVSLKLIKVAQDNTGIMIPRCTV